MEHLGHSFAYQHVDELKEFLCEALKHGYGTDERPEVFSDGQQLLRFEKGDWLYEDLWYGGEPFGGMTTVSFQGRVCWVMTYYGQILPYTGANPKHVLQCLGGALRNFNPVWPIRGPGEYRDGNAVYEYRNKWEAPDFPLIQFKGTERIVNARTRKKVYTMDYAGGFVDLD